MTNHTTAALGQDFQGSQDWQMTAPQGAYNAGPYTRKMYYQNHDSYDVLAAGQTESLNGWLGGESDSQPTPMDSATFTGFFWSDISSYYACPAPKVQVVG